VAAALRRLPETWSVGLVLMNMNCPAYLRTDEANLERDVELLARDFGSRMIVTDRFAVAVDSMLRCRGVALADRFGLRMQTHLNEQPREKKLVESSLYPDADHYTHVYERDGLLRAGSIMAHCVHMRDAEFDNLAKAGGVIAHCATSNTLLGSGIMSLDHVHARRIPYAICTDVGASPTTSMLCEMAQFLKVHTGRSRHATPSEALYRATLAPATILGLDDQVGTLAAGRPASFIEIECDPSALHGASADQVVLSALLELSEGQLTQYSRAGSSVSALGAGGVEDTATLDALSVDVEQTKRRLDQKVIRVTMRGKTIWTRPS
jgi:guanine deaminase